MKNAQSHVESAGSGTILALKRDGASHLLRPLQCAMLIIALLCWLTSHQARAQEAETLFVNVSQAAGIMDNRHGTDKTIGQAA